ncbi:uncharacterized protein DS421_2g51070 [Arachis hypogaea]|nr:uncharacterized protein DS421_2g51070 [Arachis hypogaea]
MSQPSLSSLRVPSQLLFPLLLVVATQLLAVGRRCSAHRRVSFLLLYLLTGLTGWSLLLCSSLAVYVFVVIDVL